MGGSLLFRLLLQWPSMAGWDDALKQVVALDDQWTTYIIGHSWAKAFHLKGLPLFDEIASLVDGHVATGAGVFCARAEDDSSSVEGNLEPSTKAAGPPTSSPITDVEEDEDDSLAITQLPIKVLPQFFH
ncbi:hypothetical protein BJV74DRAFT_800183 [Russula compacta]|nr:hypothetical protein BJV74DRAFT_800183 [Russula compacta]